MTTAIFPRVDEVLPQSGRMVLLTRITDHTERRTT